MKICRRCGGEPQPLQNFYPQKTTKDGRRSYCKQCDKEKSQEWKSQHVERVQAQDKARRQKNIELIRTRQRRYSQDNRPRIRANANARRQRIHDQVRTKEKEYYQKRRLIIVQQRKILRQKNLQTIRRQEADYRRTRRSQITLDRALEAAYSAKRRARHALAPDIEQFTLQEIAERDGWRCHLCHKRVSQKKLRRNHPLSASVDHLEPLGPIGPHTRINVALAHRGCNSSRGRGRVPAQLRLLP